MSKTVTVYNPSSLGLATGDMVSLNALTGTDLSSLAFTSGQAYRALLYVTSANGYVTVTGVSFNG